jgi:thiol-disulfide isomerase/thioredoxin
MQKAFFISLFFISLLQGFSQKPRIIKWPEMEKMLNDPSDSLTVINFWATWCKPCIKEIPHFEDIRKANSSKPIRFLYISLDFSDQKKTRLDPFVKTRMQGAKVFLLDETNYDKWISKIDPGWAGGIPVTLFVNNSKKIRKFYNSELSESQLNEIISTHL